MVNIFQGERVRLTADKPGDGPIFQRWDRENTEGSRMLYEIPFPTKIHLTPDPSPQAERGENKPDGDNFPFTIETLDGETVGAIHVHDCNARCGTFKYGIAIFPDQHRKGYASEAIRLVLRYYFSERRYQKCNADVYSFNEGSIRLHETLGFTLEGRLRRTVYTNGEFFDVLCYGMTKEEFEVVSR